MLRATSCLGGGNIRYKRHRRHEEFVRGVTNRNWKKKKKKKKRGGLCRFFLRRRVVNNNPRSLWRCSLAWSVPNFCRHHCRYCHCDSDSCRISVSVNKNCVIFLLQITREWWESCCNRALVINTFTANPILDRTDRIECVT